MANPITKKPPWLRKKINYSTHQAMDNLLNKTKLHTVCQEAMCPNISECFANRIATFLILGNICTRHCTFCNISKGKPLAVDSFEPQRVANAIEELGLKYVVITSPTRDDLEDGGAEHFIKVVEAIKEMDSTIEVEILIPDMRGDSKAWESVAQSGADVIAHNIETVPRLYPIRKGASYSRSLDLLKAISPHKTTKSGIMLGLGEEEHEVIAVMDDLLDVGCSYLSIGQYLSPSSKHQEVVEFVEPSRFEYFKKVGLEMGFEAIQSSPYTRSSYMADRYDIKLAES